MSLFPIFKTPDTLLPVIVQDVDKNDILMLAYMNKEAWDLTLQTHVATFYSRSRQKLWIKGETSGDKLIVKEVYTDCDQDTILLKVIPVGGKACHTGARSCFFNAISLKEIK